MSKYLFVVSGQSNACKMFPALRAAIYGRYGDVNFVIINACHGGTPISDFLRGTPNYNAMLAQIEQYQAQGYIFARFYFWQGEADSNLIPAAWKPSFEQLVADLRTDTGANPHVVFYEIGSPPRPDDPAHTLAWNQVRYWQRQTAAEHPEWRYIQTAFVPNCPVGTPHRCDYSQIVDRTMALFP